MITDLYAVWIELDAPLFYINIPFPKPKDIMLDGSPRRSAPISPFSGWTQPPPFAEVSSISKTHTAAMYPGYVLFILSIPWKLVCAMNLLLKWSLHISMYMLILGSNFYDRLLYNCTLYELYTLLLVKVCVFIHTHIYMHVCMYIYMHLHSPGSALNN